MSHVLTTNSQVCDPCHGSHVRNMGSSSDSISLLHVTSQFILSYFALLWFPLRRYEQNENISFSRTIYTGILLHMSNRSAVLSLCVNHWIYVWFPTEPCFIQSENQERGMLFYHYNVLSQLELIVQIDTLFSFLMYLSLVQICSCCCREFYGHDKSSKELQKF